MRQIEKRMVEAVENGVNFYRDNTQVEQKGGNTYVYLFGNLIWEREDGKESFTLHGWNSVTTRSRLNALLPKRLTTKNSIPYYGNSRIPVDEWVEA